MLTSGTKAVQLDPPHQRFHTRTAFTTLACRVLPVRDRGVNSSLSRPRRPALATLLAARLYNAVPGGFVAPWKIALLRRASTDDATARASAWHIASREPRVEAPRGADVRVLGRSRCGRRRARRAAAGRFPVIAGGYLNLHASRDEWRPQIDIQPCGHDLDSGLTLWRGASGMSTALC